MTRDTLYLIDGTALLYRAYFAFIKNPLINSKAQNTGAIYGVINSFLHLLDSHDPRHIIISFDRKAPTFRHELSDAYKANRPPMPDDLISQIKPVQDFFELITLPEISLDGYEADDVLATLAEMFKKDYDVIMVTGDKDYSQLVDEHVKLYDPMKDMMIDTEAVKERYSILPEQFIDYLALVGDASDNIPGVKGIGPKTATELLNNYKDLHGIYANLEKIKDKVREKLVIDRENAFLSQKLATIIRDVPIPKPDLERISFSTIALANAIPLLDEYEVTSIKRRIESIVKHLSPITAFTPAPKPEPTLVQDDIFSSPSVPEKTDFEARCVNMQNFAELMSELKSAHLISIDTETDSLDPLQAALVGISLCTAQSHAWYIPLGHQMADNMDMDFVIRKLSQIPTDALFLGHNLKYDMHILARHGWHFANRIFDTMLAAYVLDAGTNQYSLDACAKNELAYTMQPITDLIGSGKNQISFDLVDIDRASFYAAEDAWAVYRLYHIYRKRLDQCPMKKLFDEIETPLIRVLQAMEEKGMYVDNSVLGGISKLLGHEIKELTEKIFSVAGYQFNINSTQQLAHLLFDELKLPVRKKTKTGYSTDNSVLEDLAEDYEIAEFISTYRSLTKLESTYLSALPKMTNPLTGRIHTSFNQVVASTGRLSSSNPNLQNIPIRTQLGREIRKAFAAADTEHLILAVDYSQIELRLLAIMCRDEVLIKAFQDGEDIHKRTAAGIHSKSVNEVSVEERRAAKTINFGILYGMGPQKLSRELGISMAEAKNMIQGYFDSFPGIRSFLDSCVESARKHQYCETLFGRRLYLPYINSSNQRLKSEAERVSVNMPIQGTAADLIKIAMLRIHQKTTGNPDIKMILQVHDELVFEVHQRSLEMAIDMIKREMEAALPPEYAVMVPLKAEPGFGKNWFEAH